MNIVLAGMPGSGKTTVGVELSKRLGREFIDTDGLIVEKYGAISDIFSKYGEEYFRRLEREAVKEAAASKNAVISTGGGCLADKKNVLEFRACGKIIYLKAEIGELARRLRGDDTRPLLKGDAEANLQSIYKRRAHIYEQAADYTVITDGLSPEQIAEKITEIIK